MITRLFSPRVTALTGTALLTVTLGACSNNNNDNSFSSFNEPALQLSEPSSPRLELRLPNREGVPSEQAPIRIRSAGEAALTLKSVEWVGEKPARVFMFESREEDVDEDACDSEVYFISSRTCITTGTPDFSEPLSPSEEFEIKLYISAYEPGEVNALNCPDAPESTPEEYKDRYCGAIRVTSDARNSNGDVTEGATIVYLQADASSGRINLSEQTLNFNNVAPGTSESREFSITNTGDTPLLLDRVQPSDYGQYLSIGGPTLPMELAPNASEVFTLQLEIGTDADPEALKFNTTVRIDSSAPTSPTRLDVVVDNSRVIPPVPQPDRTTVTFAGDGDEQDITFTNPSDIPVNITGVIFEPFEAQDYYAALDDEGNALPAPLVIKPPSSSNPDRNKEIIRVRYTAPTDGSSPLASMIVNFTYFVGDISKTGSLRLTLLGDKTDVAYGDLVPSTFSFSTKVDTEQSRTAAIFNLGNADLVIDEVMLMALAGSSDEFIVKLADNAPFPATITPGGVQLVEVSYSKTNGDSDQINADFTSNTGTTEGLSMTLSSFDVDPSDVTLDITSSFAEAATVGELASFEFPAGLDASIANNAEWVLIGKPATSSLIVKTTGPRAGFIPDQAGSYELLVTSSDGNTDVQTRYTFQAQ